MAACAEQRRRECLEQGRAFSAARQHDKALRAFIEGLDVASDPASRACFLFECGSAYRQLGQAGKARHVFQMSKEEDGSEENRQRNDEQLGKMAAPDAGVPAPPSGTYNPGRYKSGKTRLPIFDNPLSSDGPSGTLNAATTFTVERVVYDDDVNVVWGHMSLPSIGYVKIWDADGEHATATSL